MAGLVILAAGASARFGSPKQRLLFEGETLLQRAVHTALAAACKPVIVVLGANAAALQPEIEDEPVAMAVNPEWQEGMASSIRCGLRRLLALEPGVDGCLFMVCDQPFVQSGLLDKLVDAKKDAPDAIVACAYNNTVGTPVLFGKTFFPELLRLEGQEGAKKILLRHKGKVIPIPFPQGAIDIDTAADYAALLQDGPDLRNHLL